MKSRITLLRTLLLTPFHSILIVVFFLTLVTNQSRRQGLILYVHAKKSIPSTSQQSYLYSTPTTVWNPSPNINEDGFLKDQYKRVLGEWEVEANIGGKYGHKSIQSKKLENVPVIIRQVPGDGNCLFHSLSIALNFVERKKHLQIKNNRVLTSTRGGNNYNDENNNVLRSKKKRSRKNQNHEMTASSSHNRFNREDEDIQKLYERSSMLRQVAVEMLSPSISSHEQRQKQDENSDKQNRRDQRRRRRRRRRLLFLQGNEYLQREELLNIAASQYDLSGYEYCELMKNDGVWGGGPEIVALCNYLRRPIHVYELISIHPKRKGRQQPHRSHDHHKNEARRSRSRKIFSSSSPSCTKSEFRLRRMACFGSPKFDHKEPIHILSADCRFPDLKPGLEASNGNHFLAMFPVKNGNTHQSLRSQSRLSSSTKKVGFRLRSGASADSMDDEKKQKPQRMWKNIRNKIGNIGCTSSSQMNDSQQAIKYWGTSSKTVPSKQSHTSRRKDDRNPTIGDLLRKPYMSLMDHWLQLSASNTS